MDTCIELHISYMDCLEIEQIFLVVVIICLSAHWRKQAKLDILKQVTPPDCILHFLLQPLLFQPLIAIMLTINR